MGTSRLREPPTDGTHGPLDDPPSEHGSGSGSEPRKPVWRWWLVAVVVPIVLALLGSPFLLEWWRGDQPKEERPRGADAGTRCLLRNEMLSLDRPRQLPGGLVITLLRSEPEVPLPHVDFILEGTTSQDGQVILFADGAQPVELEDTGRRYDITVSDIRRETARFTVCP